MIDTKNEGLKGNLYQCNDACVELRYWRDGWRLLLENSWCCNVFVAEIRPYWGFSVAGLQFNMTHNTWVVMKYNPDAEPLYDWLTGWLFRLITEWKEWRIQVDAFRMKRAVSLDNKDRCSWCRLRGLEMYSGSGKTGYCLRDVLSDPWLGEIMIIKRQSHGDYVTRHRNEMLDWVTGLTSFLLTFWRHWSQEGGRTFSGYSPGGWWRRSSATRWAGGVTLLVEDWLREGKVW